MNNKSKFLIIFFKILLPIKIIIIFITTIILIAYYTSRGNVLSKLYINDLNYQEGNYKINNIINTKNNELVDINSLNIKDFNDKTILEFKDGIFQIVDSNDYIIYKFITNHNLYYKLVFKNNTIGVFEENISNDTIILNIFDNKNDIFKIIFKKLPEEKKDKEKI